MYQGRDGKNSIPIKVDSESLGLSTYRKPNQAKGEELTRSFHGTQKETQPASVHAHSPGIPYIIYRGINYLFPEELPQFKSKK